MDIGDQVHGWKEIGAYIGRTERTARRWEVKRQLPVRRAPGEGRSSVYALKFELDAWLLSAPVITEDRDVDASTESADLVSHPDAATPPIIASRTWLAPALLSAALLLAIAATTAASVRRTGRDQRLEPQVRESPGASAAPGVNELYIQGLLFFEPRTVSGVKTALQLFQEATDRDPKFALAWSALGNAYTVLGEYEAISNLDAYAKARDAAERALALDPKLAEPHANLGFLDYFRVGDAALAEQEFETALALDPKCAMAHSWFGTMLIHQGRLNDALYEFDEALRTEPHSTSIIAGHALALGLSGHRDEGINTLQKLDRESPNPIVAHHLSMLASMEPRKVELYLRSRAEIVQLENAAPVAADVYLDAEKRYAPGRGGEQAVWQALAQNKDSSSLLQAEANAALGRSDAAFAILDALERKPGAPWGLRTDPLLVSLHADRRWPNLVSRDGGTWSPR